LAVLEHCYFFEPRYFHGLDKKGLSMLVFALTAVIIIFYQTPIGCEKSNVQ
jgi:hypothetical protein